MQSVPCRLEPDRGRNTSLMTDEAPLRRHLEALLGIPATEGNRVTVYRNGDEIFPRCSWRFPRPSERLT